MRVCMDPRLFPGVRCSVLNTVKSWPSCWMTMPGRSCVALTLLICFLEVSISEIQAGQECGRIRNDSRHASAFFCASANEQYKGAASARSIVAGLIRVFQLFRNPGALPRRAFRNSEREPGASRPAFCDKPESLGRA